MSRLGLTHLSWLGLLALCLSCQGSPVPGSAAAGWTAVGPRQALTLESPR